MSIGLRTKFTSARIPVEYSKARLRLVQKLEVIYHLALNNRCEECKKAGIEYLHGICGVSPDKATARLEQLYHEAHIERVFLFRNINGI